jgi:glutaminyl-tRNA synthetase
MPTIAGMRRRGYTPEAIRASASEIGVTKFNSTCRHGRPRTLPCGTTSTRRLPRVMAVLKPIKVVIDELPAEGPGRRARRVNNPEDAQDGQRARCPSRELWIEQDDFMEDPPKQFHRLAPGKEVRLRWAYFIKCRA